MVTYRVEIPRTFSAAFLKQKVCFALLTPMRDVLFSSKATIASALSVQTPSVPVADYRGTLIVTGRLAGKAEPVILQFAGRNLERKGKFFDETEVYFQVCNFLNIN